MGKRIYSVSCMCIYAETVLANSPEEAADIVVNRCLYDVDGEVHVEDLDSGEEFDV